MKRFLLPALVALALTACSRASAVPDTVLPGPTSPASQQQVPAADLSRVDEQGAVVVEVQPLNLEASATDLDFAVAMNTHSVDLGMDLTSAATLTTDTGITVQPTAWDGPRGGHHISGTLVFPASQDGKPILQGASKLTLTISNVGAPSRVFEWALSQ